MKSGLIKIGRAKDPKKRLSAMQTGSAEPLHVLWSYEATQSHEGDLHRHFGEARTRGEWFRPTPELLAYIDAGKPGAFDWSAA